MQTQAPTPNHPSTFELALIQLREILEDGLRHGFFEVAVSGEIVKDKKRQLVIRAGKSHKFTIPEHELPAR